MNIPSGKYGKRLFVAYMVMFGIAGGLAGAQLFEVVNEFRSYFSPQAVKERLVKSYDKEKERIVKEVADASTAAGVAWSEADKAAYRARDMADYLKKERDASISFWSSCNDANQLGTDMPPVDCSTMPVTDAEISWTGALGVPVELLGLVDEKEPMFLPKETHMFVNWGHGLNEDGRWRDDGAVAPDGTTERSLVMGIAETAYNHAKKVERLASVIQVGKEPHSLRDNVNFATDQASKIGCGRTSSCYLLSVHANSSPDSSKYGAIAFYNPYSVQSRQFAESLASCLGGRAVSDQSNRFGRLAMVRDVEQVDGVLLETGYLTNPQDLARLKSGQAGSQVAKCVEAFFNNR